MKEKFKHITFKGSTLLLINQAVAILNELMAQGYKLTLRQLFYQLVARDIIQNKFTEYKRLGSIINNARLAGIIDWDAIEDRTRNLQGVPHWKEPQEVIRSAAASFRLDKWADQNYRIEVWVEKDALVGVLERACRELDVDWFSCRGYTSQSELYGASKRLSGYIYRDKQTPVIIHLGDHDPSGMDMTRDILDRLFMFMDREIRVERIALNMDQIDEYHPPPNFAKVTDSRFKTYNDKFGDESWELDALDVRVIHNLITEKVSEYKDEDRFNALKEEEDEKRKLLAASAENWEQVSRLLEKFERDKNKPKRRRRKKRK